MASTVPISATPVTGTGECGCGSRSFSSDWMTNTSPGWLAPSRPTLSKIGGAIRPISSVLRMTCEGTSATIGVPNRPSQECAHSRQPGEIGRAAGAVATVRCALPARGRSHGTQADAAPEPAMSDNPFAEPDDDRTVFRPDAGRPARRGRPPPPAAAAPTPRRAAAAAAARAAAAASRPAPTSARSPARSPTRCSPRPRPLLQLLARLRNTATPPDQGDMRDRTAREMREFERRAREAGVPMEQVRPAHYALCASLDDVVLNTPWGAHGRWKQRTLAATFHQDEGGGDGFFDQLRLHARRPGQAPGRAAS